MEREEKERIAKAANLAQDKEQTALAEDQQRVLQNGHRVGGAKMRHTKYGVQYVCMYIHFFLCVRDTAVLRKHVILLCSCYCHSNHMPSALPTLPF